MKLLIVQLSDIHLKSDANPVTDRAAAIASAIHGSDVAFDACLIAASGDIAFSGKQAEYGVAREFFDVIKQQLTQLQPNIYYGEAFIPGNHDCELPQQTRSREILIKDILANPPTPSDRDDSPIHDCLKTQESFFAFAASRLPGSAANSTLSEQPTLYYNYLFELASRRIRFECYNTSWLSMLHEQAGRLLAATWLPTAPPGQADVVITLLHHPFNWLEPNNGKQLRQQIEQAADIILTGHEHVPDQYKKQTIGGADLMCFEGSVLQESGAPDVSGFNVLAVDLEKQQYKVILYTWQDDIYVAETETDWLAFQRNRARPSTGLALSDTFAAVLDDAGAPFSHPRKASLALSDLFVYPDLEDRTLPDRSNVLAPRIIRGDQVRLYLRTHKHILLMGRERAGKTSLIKTLYREGFEPHQFPLLLSGAQLKSPDQAAFRRMLQHAVEDQYGRNAVDRYMQLAKSSRVLLLDDLHRSPLPYLQLNAVIALAMSLFEAVILTADDVFPLAEMALGVQDQLELLSFHRCFILPFGYARRGEIIEKWLRLGQDDQVDDAAIYRRVRETENRVTTLIGTNLLPPSPFFVLTILQLAEGNIPHNTALGAYGYHYEAIITESLSRTLTSLQSKLTMDTLYTFVSRVAYRMLQEKRRFLTRDELEEVTAEYKESFSVRVSLEQILGVLSGARILHEDAGGRFVFIFRYVYYYFVAKYIASNLYTSSEADELRAVVDNMAAKLYVEDYANILIFLVYLTKDERAIGAIVDRAKSLYQDDTPCDFDSHVAFTSRLHGKPLTFSLGAAHPQQAQREYRAHLDSVDRIRQEQDDDELYLREEQEALAAVVRLNEALKTIQIMGQILCNFPGALPGETKLQIASESYTLGFRMLHSIYSTMEANLAMVREFLAEMMKEVKGITDEDELAVLADRLLYQMVFGSAYGVIKRLSSAAGSEHLADTYRRVPAVGSSIPIDLVDLAIKLDHFPTFPEAAVTNLDERTKKNGFAASLLRLLVRDHFYLYTEDFRLRQRVCARLGIAAQEPRMLGIADKQD